MSVSGLFVCNIILLSPAPEAFNAIGWKYYLVFTILTTVMVFVAYFFFPEVSSLDLADRITLGTDEEGCRRKGCRLKRCPRSSVRRSNMTRIRSSAKKRLPTMSSIAQRDFSLNIITAEESREPDIM